MVRGTSLKSLLLLVMTSIFVHCMRTNLVRYSRGVRQPLLLGSSIRSFSAVPRDGNRPNEKSVSSFHSQKTFENIGVNENMRKVLGQLGITKPSKIQAIAIPKVFTGNHCIIGDQTGSGKTLAYLVPLIQRMQDGFMEGKLVRQKERSPYILIVTPTTDLANQVSKVTKRLANALKFRTSCFTSQSDFDAEQRRLRQGSDVLISTPGRLVDLLKRKLVQLDDLQSIVLDEVDSLYMDRSHPLEPIGSACPPTCQFVFASATLPQDMVTRILSEFPGALQLTGPGLHRVAGGIREVVVDCTPPRLKGQTSLTPQQLATKVKEETMINKINSLDQALKDNVNCKRTIIFCNTIEQCRKVENHLKRCDEVEVFVYHSAIHDDVRAKNLKEFAKGEFSRPAVLICTDRASRGMDFDEAFVEHVILFDFPLDPSEYLRRIGRTGRAGRTGVATILVFGPQVASARAVMAASLEGKRLEPLAVSPFDGDATDANGKTRKAVLPLPNSPRATRKFLSAGPTAGAKTGEKKTKPTGKVLEIEEIEDDDEFMGDDDDELEVEGMVEEADEEWGSDGRGRTGSGRLGRTRDRRD